MNPFLWSVVCAPSTESIDSLATRAMTTFRFAFGQPAPVLDPSNPTDHDQVSWKMVELQSLDMRQKLGRPQTGNVRSGDAAQGRGVSDILRWAAAGAGRFVTTIPTIMPTRIFARAVAAGRWWCRGGSTPSQ